MRNINTASDNKYYALLMPYVPVGIKETKKKIFIFEIIICHNLNSCLKIQIQF